MKDPIIIERTCPFCGAVTTVTVDSWDYQDWAGGKCAQNAFPYLSAAEREVIISGLCLNCQGNFFGD